MNMSLSKIVSLAVALSATAIAMADGLADFKNWYAKDSQKMVKAMESKNLAFFDKCSTADFTYKGADGKVAKKKEAMAGLKQMMDGADSIKYKFKTSGFKSGKGAMMVDLLNEYTMTMKPGPDNKKHVMWMRMKTRETWVKSGKGWLLKNITDVGTPEMKMDGKPMPAGAMGGG